MPGSDDVARTEAPASAHRQRWYRVALAVCVLLVLGGVALLPLVLRSIYDEVIDREHNRLFNLKTGQEVMPGAEVDPNAPNYLNIAMVDLDQEALSVTLAVSGNRVCLDRCPEIELMFLSLDNDASQRRGISPAASIVLDPDETTFSQSITLPVQGAPVRYPFDRYHLWFGLADSVATTVTAGADGAPSRPPSSRFVITVQNQIPQIEMGQPIPVTQERIRKPLREITIQAVQSLTFSRPAYLTVLTVALVLLVAASGAMALMTQSIDSLVLGVGGLILGIWGVRSVLVPQPVGVITAVDLTLSGVIFVLLLGLATRAALYLRKHAGLSPHP